MPLTLTSKNISKMNTIIKTILSKAAIIQINRSP